MTVDLLYVVSNGFAARMVLHSELLPELVSRGVRVGIMAPNADAPHMKALCERRAVEVVPCPAPAGTLLSLYGDARRYLFEDYQRNAALRAKHEWEWHAASGSQILRARSIAGKGVNKVMLRAPRLRAALARAETSALRSPALRTILAEQRPKALVVTYPVNWVEALSVIEAQRLGILTIGQLLSWDNISCKGRFAAVPDRFVSWGPIMTAELAEYYGVSGASVVEAGVAHFDMHARPPPPAQIDADLTALGLDPRRPYLFFGMSASFFAPKEPEIVAWLARKVRAGAFGPDMQLVVRPHPQSMRGRMADPDLVRLLEQIVGDRVVLDVPEVVSDSVDMGDGDMLRLVGLISRASVTLNSGSTLSIDALLHDRPVVLSLFDAEHRLPWYKSARRIEEFPHIDKLLAFGGIARTHDFAELEAAISSYLADPGRDAAARARAIQAECGPRDGGACKRIADGLTSFLRPASP